MFYLAARRGIEPLSQARQARIIPIYERTNWVSVIGIEPTWSAPQTQWPTNGPHGELQNTGIAYGDWTRLGRMKACWPHQKSNAIYWRAASDSNREEDFWRVSCCQLHQPPIKQLWGRGGDRTLDIWFTARDFTTKLTLPFGSPGRLRTAILRLRLYVWLTVRSLTN